MGGFCGLIMAALVGVAGSNNIGATTVIDSLSRAVLPAGITIAVSIALCAVWAFIARRRHARGKDVGSSGRASAAMLVSMALLLLLSWLFCSFSVGV